MDFLKTLTSLARLDERISDLATCCSDTRQLAQLLRHARGLRAPCAARLLQCAAVPAFLAEQPFQRLFGDFLVAGGRQRIYVFNVRSSAVLTVNNGLGAVVDACASGFACLNGSNSANGGNSENSAAGADSDAAARIFILLETGYVVLQQSSCASELFQTEISFKCINMRRSDAGEARLRIEARGTLSGAARACCALEGLFYVATARGICVVDPVAAAAAGGLTQTPRNAINSILNTQAGTGARQSLKSRVLTLFHDVDTVQLVADTSRGLYFALSSTGGICAYQGLKQLKSAVLKSEIIAIDTVSALESQSICLCGIDAAGSLSYFQICEGASAEIQLFKTAEDPEFDCLKLFTQRSEKISLRRFKSLCHAPGSSLLLGGSELQLDLLDQTKKCGVSYQYDILYENEEIKDAAFTRAPLTGNALFTQYQNAPTEFCVLTDRNLRRYAVAAPCELLETLLRQSEGEEHWFTCFSLFKQLYGEQETVAMLVYLRACGGVFGASGAQAVENTAENTVRTWECAEPLARVRFEQLQLELPQRCRAAQAILDKHQSQEFQSAVNLLVERIAWHVLNFQFIYVPETRANDFLALQGLCIPFATGKRGFAGTAHSGAGTQNAAFVPFSHARIFEIAVRLQNIQIYLEQAQDYAQKQAQNQSAAEALEYLKEILFFLALSLQPQNLPRVLPELFAAAGSAGASGTYEKLPKLLGGGQTRYLTCGAHGIKFYLEYNNRNALEALVRRLNLVVQGGAVQATATSVPRPAFQQDFNALCKVLSQVFAKRLTALQLLQAAATANTVVRRQNVDEAFRILQGKYSMLTPLAPLRSLFSRCESLQTLMKLILTAKNDHVRAFGAAVQQNALFQQAIRQTADGNTNSGVSLFNNIRGGKFELKGWMLCDSEEENDQGRVVAPYAVRTSFEALAQAVRAASAEQAPVMTVGFSLQPGSPLVQMNEEQCLELFQALGEALSLIQDEYLFQGLSERISSFQVEDAGRPAGQLFSKGIRLVQAAVIACKEQFWHYELYRFLYAHYYFNAVVLEAAGRDARGASNMALHTEVCDRARQALLSIVSPYIAEFLRLTDAQLHLRYLEKNQKIPEFCNTAYQIASQYGRQCVSALPNACTGGVWERQPLNFKQMSDILHSTYAKLSGGKMTAETQKSLFQTQTAPSAFNVSQLPQQNLLQLQEFFRTHIQLAEIQQEFADRAGQGREAEILHRRLLMVSELDQMLKQNKFFDLSLILQYNIINKSQARQFLIPSWKGLFAQNPLEQDLQQLQAVLLRTELVSDDLALPVQILVEKHAQAEQFDAFVSAFAKIVFRQYQFVGRVVAAALALAVGAHLTQRQQELAGLLCLRLLELKQALPPRAGDAEISTANVRRELSKAQRSYASWQRAMK